MFELVGCKGTYAGLFQPGLTEAGGTAGGATGLGAAVVPATGAGDAGEFAGGAFAPGLGPFPAPVGSPAGSSYGGLAGVATGGVGATGAGGGAGRFEKTSQKFLQSFRSVGVYSKVSEIASRWHLSRYLARVRSGSPAADLAISSHSEVAISIGVIGLGPPMKSVRKGIPAMKICRKLPSSWSLFRSLKNSAYLDAAD